MSHKKLIATGALVAAGVLTFAGCTPPSSNNGGGSNGSGGNGGASSTANAGANQTITALWNQAFYSANPNTADANNVVNANIAYMANDSLTYYDKDLKLVKNTSFGTYQKTSDNPLTVKVNIADNAQWSDGTPVTAADFILAWGALSTNFNTMSDEDATKLQDKTTQQMGAAPDGQVYFNASSTGMQLIKDLPQGDANAKSFTYTFADPYADWETNGLIGPTVPAHIIAKRALKTTDATKGKQAVVDAFKNKDNSALSKIANSFNRDWAFQDMPQDKDLLVSDGPMIITDMAKGQYVTLSRNPNYKGDHKPQVGKITVRFNEDASASVQALQNREVQIISPQATADILKSVQGLNGINVNTSDQASYEHIDLTMNNGGPFDPAAYGGDAEKARMVRQAFIDCIPRQTIVDKLIKPLNPKATIRQSFTTMPSDPNYKTVTAANNMESTQKFDVAAAKDLLQKAGATSPMVKFMHADGNQRRQQEYQLIKEQCSQAGFQFTEMSEAKWSSKLGDKSYDAVVFAWSSTNTAVTGNQDQYATGGQNNFSKYSNSTVDGLFKQLQTTTDTSKQATILSQVEAQLVKDAFGTVIFQFPSVTAWDKNVSNVSDCALTPNYFWNFWEWTTK